MPKLYLVTIDGRPHPYCAWNDEPVPVFRGDSARYRLLAQTDDTAEAIWLSEMLEEELRTGRKKIRRSR